MPNNRKRKISILYCAIFIIIALLSVITVMLVVNKNNEFNNIDDNGEIISKVIPKSTISNDILIETKSIGSIPVIEYSSKIIDEVKPLIIMQHGLLADKESMSQLAKVFASQGFFVVTPDAYAHGDYKIKEDLKIIDITIKTAEAFDIIIEFYDKNVNVDNKNFGLLGISLGGIADYYYCVNGEYIPKIVGTISSTPYWEDLITTDVFHNTYKNNRLKSISENESEKLDELLIKYSPFNKLLTVSDTRFFIINGSEDEFIPVYGCELFYTEFIKQEPDKIIFHIVEGMAHEATYEIEDLLIEMLFYYKDIFVGNY